jgi:L-alanine-DL-glutamate epimerase-like enolase superfamily enzyme
MKITDIELIRFRLPTRGHGTKWGYGRDGEQQDGVQTITRIVTDEGAEGFSTGGVAAYFYGPKPDDIEQIVKPLLVGQDALDRELLWHWMKGNRRFSEQLIGNIDSALWDLAGREAGQTVSQLLGRVRTRVRAYASTAPNLGPPEVYAQLAKDCRDRGYTAFKIHGYIFRRSRFVGACAG